MSQKEVEQKIIERYQQDENMMILVFAQWCVNNDLDPETLYVQAYPDQKENLALKKVLELTVPKNESEHIPAQTVLNVLQFFGNDDLAYMVTKEIEKMKR
ncbi:hypothetical protein [Aquibacillus sediminis]|uniref:hypothetical protein n=1 Tax=Aquibacillus sediminis TaxID=2574734 RepID=UPI0011084458|nr:hypothetical protein [Aquibacillus sediminis]